MQHCDEQTLGLLALGEPAPSADQIHLAGCEQCRAEVTSLRSVVALVRGEAAPPVVPPPSVWAGIAAATGVAATPREDELRRFAAAPVPPAPSSPSSPSAVDAAGAPPRGPSRGHLTSVPREHPEPDPFAGLPVSATAAAPSRRSLRGSVPAPRRWTPLVAVAAAGLVIGGVGGAVVARQGQDPVPATSVVASVALSGLEAAPAASGEARVVETADGRRLAVDVAALDATDGFYEVWLIDASVERMVPVGILEGATGEFVIPDGLELGEFPVVDVSVEPFDGDPTHSGTSVLRGIIES